MLIDHQDIIRYRANETIIQEGAEEQSFFIILKGRVGINKKMRPSPLSRHLSELETGQCFGEMAVITGRPRSASVVALEETYVFRADPEMLNASIDDPVLLRIESKIYKKPRLRARRQNRCIQSAQYHYSVARLHITVNSTV